MRDTCVHRKRSQECTAVLTEDSSETVVAETVELLGGCRMPMPGPTVPAMKWTGVFLGFMVFAFAGLGVSSAPARAASGAPTPPIVIGYPWRDDICGTFGVETFTDAAGNSTATMVCTHGPEWGKKMIGYQSNKVLTWLLNGKWVCTKN